MTRSDRSRILISALAISGAMACSHAQPTPEAPASSDATQPAATGEAAQPAEGAKLAGDKDEGAPAPRPAAALAPKPNASPEVREAFAEANQAATSGDVDGAMRTLRRALERNPNLPWAHYNLGALYERRGQNADALSEYRRALDVDPECGEAAIAEARLLLRQKRLSEAEADLRGRLQKTPNALGLRNGLVFALVQGGQYEPAITEAKKVLKADERNVDAMFQLSTVYYKQGKNELSRMVLNNAKAIRPNDPEIHNALGFVDIALGEKPKALEEFKQAAALSPDFAEAHNNLGALLNEAQDYPSAVKELELAVRDAPDFVAARLNLGNAYRGNQQYDQALGQYQKVLELSPNSKDALFNLAVLYFDGEFAQMSATDRLNRAGDYFEKYRTAGGDDPKVEQYKKDLAKLLAAEKRRQEREAKDKLKKAKAQQSEQAKPQPAVAKPAPSEGQKLKDRGTPTPAANGGKLGGGDEK